MIDSESSSGFGAQDKRVLNVFLITLCMPFLMIGPAGIALFLPVIRQDLDLTFTQGGSISSVTFLFYALMQIPSGFMADRYRLKSIFLLGMFGTTTLGLAFSQVNTYWQAIIMQALNGVFMSFTFTAGITLLGTWFVPRRRATAMALALVGISLGDLLMNTTGPQIARLSSWRLPVMSFALIGIMASLIYFQFGKEPDRASSGQAVRLKDVFGLFRHGFMWVCAAIQYIRLGVMMGISFWLPSFLVDERGHSLQVAGLIIACRTLLMPPTNILGGYMSDRLKSPTIVIASSLVALAITSSLLGRIDNLPLLFSLIIINALFVQLYVGPLFAAPVEKYGPRMMGTISGFGNFFANMGGFTFIYLLGIIKDKLGLFEFGFYSIAGACVAGIVFTIFLEKMRRVPAGSGRAM